MLNTRMTRKQAPVTIPHAKIETSYSIISSLVALYNQRLAKETVMAFLMYIEVEGSPVPLVQLSGSDRYMRPHWCSTGNYEAYVSLERTDHSLTFSKQGARQCPEFKHKLRVEFLQATVFLNVEKRGDDRYYIKTVKTVHIDRCHLDHDPVTGVYAISRTEIANGSVEDVNRMTQRRYVRLIDEAIKYTQDNLAGTKKRVASRSI